jgi:RNA polymerase sigma-70 factor (ECF subfamily)
MVSRILSGDTQAFRLLVKQNERLVVHMVSRLVDRTEDREEICQDVFVKVYEKIGDFNFQSQLSTWIATIAYRHAINHLRKKKLWVTEIPEEETFSDRFIADDKTETLAERDAEELIMQMIDLLPPQYKIVITLYHVDGKNYAEIGEITGMPEGTVKNYLFRARQILKNKVRAQLGSEIWT